MRGSNKPTGVQVSYGVRGFVKLRDARKGWLWESGVLEALDLRTRGTGASRTSGMRVSTQRRIYRYVYRYLLEDI